VIFLSFLKNINTFLMYSGYHKNWKTKKKGLIMQSSLFQTASIAALLVGLAGCGNDTKNSETQSDKEHAAERDANAPGSDPAQEAAVERAAQDAHIVSELNASGEFREALAEESKNVDVDTEEGRLAAFKAAVMRTVKDPKMQSMALKAAVVGGTLLAGYFAYELFQPNKDTDPVKVGKMFEAVNAEIVKVFMASKDEGYITDVADAEKQKADLLDEAKFVWGMTGVQFETLWKAQRDLLEERNLRAENTMQMAGLHNRNYVEPMRAVVGNDGIAILNWAQFFEKSLTGFDAAADKDVSSMLFGSNNGDSRKGRAFAEYFGVGSFEGLKSAVMPPVVEEPYNFAVARADAAKARYDAANAKPEDVKPDLGAYSLGVDTKLVKQVTSWIENDTTSEPGFSEDVIALVKAAKDEDRDRLKALVKAGGEADVAFKRLKDMVWVLDQGTSSDEFKKVSGLDKDPTKEVNLSGAIGKLITAARQDLDANLKANADVAQNPNRDEIKVKANNLLDGNQDGFASDLAAAMGAISQESADLTTKLAAATKEKELVTQFATESLAVLSGLIHKTDDALLTPLGIEVKNGLDEAKLESIKNVFAAKAYWEGILGDSTYERFLKANPVDGKPGHLDPAEYKNLVVAVKDWFSKLPKGMIGYDFVKKMADFDELDKAQKAVAGANTDAIAKYKAAVTKFVGTTNLGVFFGNAFKDAFESKSTPLAMGADMLNSSFMAARVAAPHVSASNFSLNGNTGADMAWNLPCTVSLEGEWSSVQKDVRGMISQNFGSTFVAAQFAKTGDDEAFGARVTQKLDTVFAEVAVGSMNIDGSNTTQAGVRAGLDLGPVAPFVEVQHRSDDQNVTGNLAFVGLEAATFKTKVAEATLTANAIAKVGMEALSSGPRSESSSVGSVSMNIGCDFAGGVSVKADLGVSSKSESAQFSVGLER
jgi:hypothetical protein